MSDYYALANERLQRKLDGIKRRIESAYRDSDGDGTADVLSLLCQRDRVLAQMCNLAGRA